MPQKKNYYYVDELIKTTGKLTIFISTISIKINQQMIDQIRWSSIFQQILSGTQNELLGFCAVPCQLF